jgi:hypothetical protein
MTDDEWVYFAPFLTHRGGRPPHNHRHVLDGVVRLTQRGRSYDPIITALPGTYRSSQPVYRRDQAVDRSIGAWDKPTGPAC